LSPLQAKQLSQSLAENVTNFEKSFGEIKEPQVNNGTATYEA